MAKKYDFGQLVIDFPDKKDQNAILALKKAENIAELYDAVSAWKAANFVQPQSNQPDTAVPMAQRIAAKILEMGMDPTKVDASIKAMVQQLLTLEDQNKALTAKGVKALTVKRTEKGGASVYGLGRFPVTLYREQWERLLAAKDEIMAVVETLPTKAENA